MRRAFVLGGGVAGIAAAFALRDRGLEVELIEARRWLGGRAFSLPERRLRGSPDNGPHVMLGCYTHMRRLLRRLGTEAGFVAPRTLELAYRGADGAASRLRLARLPAPLALPPALARLPGMRPGEKLRALRGLVSALRGAPAAWTLEDWIRRRSQDGGPRRYLWDPMCRAVMNAEADQVAADLFLGTVRRAFSGSAAAAAIWIPARPWSELIGEPAAARLGEAGVRLCLGRRVVAMPAREGRVAALRLSDGEARRVDRDDLVVSALPWHAAGRLVPGLPDAVAIGASPMVSIWLEFDAPLGLPSDPLVSLVDGEPFHFLFRRPGCAPGELALVAGGCRGLDGLSVAEVEVLARRQMARHYPDCPLPDGGRVRVVREPRATILAVPGQGALRPPPGRCAGLDNLLLCGDWTRTGLPSTLEGAVESAWCALSS